MKIIFATHNNGKLKEMREILRDLDIDLLSTKEVGLKEEPIEDGATFEENALKKARFTAAQTKEWAIADDSGICIDELGGLPGVVSARWAGEGASDEKIIRHTLTALASTPPDKRGAYFETAAVLTAPDGRYWIFTAKINGHIATAPRGLPRPKLPYDLIFIPDGHQKTFAEMSDDEKNSLSHRGLAFRQLKAFLTGEFELRSML